MSDEVQIMFSAGHQFYAVPDVRRECGIWLSMEKHPLPVPVEWRRPHSVAAAVMRGRDYYRIAIFGPQHTDGSSAAGTDDELVRDYRDAAWWTPGLEEAWTELDDANAAPDKAEQQHAQATRLQVAARGAVPQPFPLPQNIGRGAEKEERLKGKRGA
jgi:hypothetical protein